MTNVVDVYINYLRRKVDTGYDRALIRTVRGVGYQIGEVRDLPLSCAGSHRSDLGRTKHLTGHSGEGKP